MCLFFDAVLEGVDSVLDAGMTWYMDTIHRKSKLKAIKRAKTPKNDETET